MHQSLVLIFVPSLWPSGQVATIPAVFNWTRNYLFGTQSTHGGFLPVFWNAPTAYMHAATDIGCVVEWVQSKFRLTADENGCLAVLHNRNHMVTTFGNSEAGKVQSKSVTSCAGMTAHLVLLAQTRVGIS